MKRSDDIFSTTLNQFRIYLRLERSLSENTLEGYSSDCAFFFDYLARNGAVSPESADILLLSSFLADDCSKKRSKRSQARMISSLKAMYRFLEIEGRIIDNPCDKLDAPKINPALPTVLSVEEVFRIIDSVDLSRPEGHRNKAIVEVLYSCGLRVSELVNLKISDIFFDEKFICVFGKGAKQRLVPIGEPALKSILLYLEVRNGMKIAKGDEDILFLNRRGGRMTREMVFIIVKRLALDAGVDKVISPHTFRHSFATHLVENGADLRVVQEMLGHESVLTTEIYTHIDTVKWQETVLRYHPANYYKGNNNTKNE